MTSNSTVSSAIETSKATGCDLWPFSFRRRQRRAASRHSLIQTHLAGRQRARRPGVASGSLALDFGMGRYDPAWQRGDPPHIIGVFDGRRVVTGKLSWYQPLCRCHWIAFFSAAIGVLNYPDLDWRIVSGDLHTIPVGFDAKGKPRVVMDILLFDCMTAAESIAHTQGKAPPGFINKKVQRECDKVHEWFNKIVIPRIRRVVR